MVQNSVDHSDISQHDIQILLWAILARTKFSDLSREMQATAARLLTTKEILDLNGGALGILTDDKLAGAFIKEPPLLRQIYEAEAKIRNMLTNPGATFADLERIAVLTGEAPWGKDSRAIPSGRWSLHPDGYYIRYVPSGYSQTRIQIFVEEGSKADGVEFDPATHIAVPGNTARQRIMQSARRWAAH